MELSKDEKIILNKFRRAKKYAQDNRQAGLEICLLPGGKTYLIKAVFQEKINIEQVTFNK